MLYTLLIVISLSMTSTSSGVALNSQMITGFTSAQACEAAGTKALKDLEVPVPDMATTKNTVRYSCIKTK